MCFATQICTLKRFLTAAAVVAVLTACGCSRPVNNPRPLADYAENTLFSSFSGRSPKTLDPQVSYSSDETIYTYTIYEPPYGYHYLKRPYEVIPKTAERVVTPVYLDKNGRELAPGADVSASAFSRYVIPIKKGSATHRTRLLRKTRPATTAITGSPMPWRKNSPTPWTFRKKERGN